MLQNLGLLLDRKIVLGIDHRFALSSPALVSAPSKKSFSRVNCADLGVKRLHVDSGRGLIGLGFAAKTPAAPSRSWLFHCVIWSGDAYVKLLGQLGKCLFSLERRPRPPSP